MRSPTGYGEIVHTYRGRGEITFPRGGRIQSSFQLTEYSTGHCLLACEGQFTQASYPAWERLVHRYRLDTRQPLAQAQQRGLTASYAGQTADDQPVIIAQMALIGAEARGLAVFHKNLTLQMQFACQDIHIE